ncbi:hypothetical protein PV327_004154 [Microctonus hyperodae]|uniref:Uncharacterized protein n=1 Tax=Microctonus hyperodae TaxID=165561 RepID=A0AA39KMC9_MICHY|nr:hypothetical protein PV327_004154 [Microctonus hyperodae]
MNVRNFFFSEKINELQDSTNVDDNLNEEQQTSGNEKGCESVELQFCIICSKSRKRCNNRKGKLHLAHKPETLDRFESNASLINDAHLYDNFERALLEGKQIYYHASCKNHLESTSESIVVAQKPQTVWHTKRHSNAIVFDEVCEFIEKDIVQNKNCYFFSFITNLYKVCLKQEYSDSSITTEDVILRTNCLEEDLITKFHKKISIVTINKKKLIKPYGSDFLTTVMETLEKRDIVERASLILREEVEAIQGNMLPDDILTNDLIAEECPAIPKILEDFYVSLLSGSNYRRKHSANCQRLAVIQSGYYL